MRKPLAIGLCTLAALAAVWSFPRLAAQPPARPAAPPKWEYKTMKLEAVTALAPRAEAERLGTSLDAGLNVLGSEGWELVGIEPRGAGDKDKDIGLPYYYFRRSR